MTFPHIEKILRQHFNVPEDVQRLANMATLDLLWGPIGLDDDWERDNYQGFQSACKRIGEYIDTLPSQVWVDVDCDFVMDTEPQGEEIEGEWVEPFWESIYLVNGRKELVELLLNQYLVGYV